MKKSLLIAVLAAAMLSAHGAGYSKELAAVKAGKTTAARAEWWGYNTADCTKSLQDALNSGVKKLIISKQAGPWLVKKTLQLPSNIDIFFEDGAEIKAAAGCFKRNIDSLLKARGQKNITLRGKGIISMRKADYQNPKLYKPGEHRHTLGLFSCQNIRIEGLTMQKSGGDGIYVNNIKNIVIENVVLDDHHRQGISVISAENLLIKDCVIKNTSGTAPQCGIDFEPNNAREKLKNCRVVNCRFENNAHSAVNVSLALKGRFNNPADIIVENCIVKGGQYGFSSMIPGKADQPTGTLREGRFLIRNCRIENTVNSAFYLQSHRVDGEKIIVENCKVNNPDATTAPIYFFIRPPAVGSFGNVEFKNCIINAPKAKQPLTYITMMPQCKLTLTERAGNIVFNGRKVNLKKYADSQNYQKDPVMFGAFIPLLGFDVKSTAELKIVKLADEWHFKMDQKEVGERQKWQNLPAAATAKWAAISIGHWEKAKCSSAALRKQLKTYDGIGWYAQNFTLPTEWKGRRVYLYCGAVDEAARFFLNGKFVGERLHDFPNNWMLPFAVRIDQGINWNSATQQLIVRVEDRRGGGGIWKPVWLIAK